MLPAGSGIIGPGLTSVVNFPSNLSIVSNHSHAVDTHYSSLRSLSDDRDQIDTMVSRGLDMVDLANGGRLGPLHSGGSPLKHACIPTHSVWHELLQLSLRPPPPAVLQAFLRMPFAPARP